ncbi:MAG: chemotaxis protein [Proteobacteria bacterium]|nr:chemotaxis protein [Pseudomonadota bacterium]
MKIRDKIKVGAAIVLVVAAVTGALFFYYAYRQEKALNEIKVSSDLIRKEFELIMFTQDYLKNHSKRAQEQMTAQHEVIGNILEKLTIAEEGKKEIYETIKENHKFNREKFKMLLENDASLASAGKHESEEKEFEERLTGQILATAQSIVSDMFNLTEENTSQSLQLEQDRKMIVSTALSVLIIIFGFILFIGWNVTKTLTETINAVSSTYTEISVTVSQHERTAAQQASMVNETTTTMDELGASSKQTFDQASIASDVGQRALKLTEEGNVIVRQSIDGINDLGDKIGTVADQIVKLGEQTAQIGNIANIVKDLSAEINMLALNAAVEAARAGEHGRGFAVVAGEVRKLANESKKLAEQTNAIISDIQKATNATVIKTEEGTRVVEEVSGYARSVEELFSSLSEAANTVYENTQQVSMTAKQQSTAIGQVIEAMNALNMGARETSAGISQTKAGIEQLNSVNQNLMKMV